MKKTFVLMAVLLALSTPVLANVVNGDWNTGDETGWTQWFAPWGGGYGWGVTFGGPTMPEGTLTMQGNGSFGWYQVIPCAVGNRCFVFADWAGQLGGAGWAEVDFWSEAAVGGEGGRADTGNAGDIAFKKDSWGQNTPPTTWDWQPAQVSPANGGNGGVVLSQGYVVVALKLGGFSPPEYCSFDNIVVRCIPEPGSLFALVGGLVGLAGFAIRRRR